MSDKSLNESIAQIRKLTDNFEKTKDIMTADKLLSEVNYLLFKIDSRFVPSVAFQLYYIKRHQYVREDIQTYINDGLDDNAKSIWNNLNENDKNEIIANAVENYTGHKTTDPCFCILTPKKCKQLFNEIRKNKKYEYANV